MPRVASLFLPDFATDRLRRIDRRTGRATSPPPLPDEAAAAGAGDAPAVARAGETAAARGGGWRPGARWARAEEDHGSTDWLERRLVRKRAQKAAIQAEIDRLPAHQRPPMRELGRRSEAAPIPFRAGRDDAVFRPMPPDEGRGLVASEPSDFGGHVRRRAGQGMAPAGDGRSAPAPVPTMRGNAPPAGNPAAPAPARPASSAPEPRGATGPVSPSGPAARLNLVPVPVSASGRPMPPAEGAAGECGRPLPGVASGSDARRVVVPVSGPVSAARGRTGEAAGTGRHVGSDVPAATPCNVLAAPAGQDAVPASQDVVRSDGGGGVRGAGPGQAAGRPAYDLAGAFWQQGAAVGREVTRAATGAARPARAASRMAPAPSAQDWPPLVTTTREGQRIVIAAACPAARAIGLVPGMALTQARAMVPGLDARPRDAAGEAADLARLARHAARWWTPLVQVAGTGLALDVTGSAHLFGGEERLCRRILGLCRRLGFAARIAVADTPASARALAAHGGGALILCPPGGVADAVAPLPLEGLGLEPMLADGLRRLGVERIGQVAALPRGPLARRFGRGTLDALDRLTGAKADPVDPLLVEEAPEAALRFAEPVLTVAGLEHALAGIAARLCEALAARGLGARALLLDCVRIDACRQVIALGLARPSRDAGHLRRLLSMRIGEIEPGFGIEAMRLTAIRADRLEAEAVTGALSNGPPVPQLSVLVDRLAVRLGRRRLYRLGPVESEVPERGQRRLGPLERPAGWADPWPRPARLLDPAEPVDHVLAELPDQPPRRFRWRGREHRVVRGDGPERIHGEWWRRSGERDAVRDYFQVEDEAGARFWLYRRGDGVDARTGDLSWHLHGLFG